MNEQQNNSRFFQNLACEYFPCHAVSDPNSFNCLFCYCPLYTLGNRCGGDYHYLENGVKDCSGCLKPHESDFAEQVAKRFPMLAELAKKR